MTSSEAGPYAVLGVAEDCSADELKRAYRELARLYHPDRNDGAEWATERWKHVNEAYEAITKPRPARAPATSPVAQPGTPRGAIAATALAIALIATGSGFILGKATTADVAAARATGVAQARHYASVAKRRAFTESFGRARRESYRAAFRAVADPATRGAGE